MAKLMAILNVTPDSFYDGKKYFSLEKAVNRAKQLEALGADIIDIGAESSRPYATPISEEEEIKRILPVIKALKTTISTPLSIDTYKPNVAKLALEHGAYMINDITGLENNEMKKIIKNFRCPAVVMHMLKTPKTMQDNPFYPKGVVSDVFSFFEKRIQELLNHQIDKKQIIIDPGIGFGKKVLDNISLIMEVKKLKKLGYPILIGASRKSFMGKILKKKAEDLLPATLAIHTIALMGGVEYIRAHDVQEHRNIIDLFKGINN